MDTPSTDALAYITALQGNSDIRTVTNMDATVPKNFSTKVQNAILTETFSFIALIL